MRRMIAALLGLMFLLLSGCAKEAALEEYPNAPGGEYISYLLQERKTVEKQLSMDSEGWDNLKDENGAALPYPVKKQPVLIMGDPYKVSFSFYEDDQVDPYFASYTLQTDVELMDYQTKVEKAEELYALFCEAFGNPAKPYLPDGQKEENQYTIENALADSFSAQPYRAVWVIEEQVPHPHPLVSEDTNTLLLGTLTIQIYPDGISAVIEYTIQDSAYSRLDAYPQKDFASGEYLQNE